MMLILFAWKVQIEKHLLVITFLLPQRLDKKIDKSKHRRAHSLNYQITN